MIMSVFQHGDVVYWCACGNVNCVTAREAHDRFSYGVLVGVVDEEFYDRVAVEPLVFRESRRINGIPINEFKDDKRHKLPKGWTYDTELFYLSFDPLPEELKSMRPDHPEDIRKCIENGWLVKSSEQTNWSPEADITKDGYRVVLRVRDSERYPYRVGLYRNEVFRNFADANAEAERRNAEILRTSMLTDEEWSIEQIEKELAHFKLMSGMTDEEIMPYKIYLLSLPRIEAVETRVYRGMIQWKYEDKKRWMDVAV